jgi:hypothetical protein
LRCATLSFVLGRFAFAALLSFECLLLYIEVDELEKVSDVEISEPRG